MKFSFEDFRNKDLRKADLRNASCWFTDFRGADLRGADLRGADLYGAELSGARLDGVKFDRFTRFFRLYCPEKGSFTGYKKTKHGIAELLIPENAKRSSATTRSCRASEVKVIRITGFDGTELTEDVSAWNRKFIYRVGETAKPDKWEEDRWIGQAHGIYFLMTRIEAQEYDTAFPFIPY